MKAFDRVSELEHRLGGDSPDDRIRAIARAEADDRITVWLMTFGFLFLLVWLPEKLSLPFWVVFLGLAAVGLGWVFYSSNTDPKHDRHLIVMRAREAVGLRRARAKLDRGEPVWRVATGSGSAELHLREDWFSDDGFWQEVYALAISLERLPPYKRDRILRADKKHARPVIQAGRELASEKGAALPFWAKGPPP